MFIIIGGDGKEYGPVTVDQVRTWINAGRANLETKAKALGSEEWRRLGDYAEFSVSELPPVMAPASGANFPGVSILAGRGARTLAALINAVFYMMCTIPGSMMISRKLIEQNPDIARGVLPRLDELDVTAFVGGVVWVWAGLLIGILLQAALLAARGQNLGKILLGIRVVRADIAQPAGFVRAALLRFLLPVGLMVLLNLFTVVLGFVFLLVDYCFIFRADQRCLHDLIANTKVVRA
jgi:uncharacterized RDD family membrane protein YckC